MITGYDFIMERLYSGDYYDYDTDFFGQKLFAERVYDYLNNKQLTDKLERTASQLEKDQARVQELLEKQKKGPLKRGEYKFLEINKKRQDFVDRHMKNFNKMKYLNEGVENEVMGNFGGDVHSWGQSRFQEGVQSAEQAAQEKITNLNNQLNEANKQLGAANKRIAGFEKGASEKAAERAKDVGQTVAKAAEETVAKEAAEEAAPWYKKAMKNKWVKYGVPVAAVGGLGAYAYGRSRNRREREYYG